MDYIHVYIHTYFILQIMKTPKYFGHSGIIIKESVHKVTKSTNAQNVQRKSYKLLSSFSR